MSASMASPRYREEHFCQQDPMSTDRSSAMVARWAHRIASARLLRARSVSSASRFSTTPDRNGASSMESSRIMFMERYPARDGVLDSRREPR